MPKPKYPHMRIWEETIMDRFLQTVTFEATYDYDVHVRIDDKTPNTLHTDTERQLWRQMTAFRIDAVIQTPANIYVAEVKDRLRPSAIGQALTYSHLYQKIHKPTKPVIPAIITAMDDPDTHNVCDRYGIKVWVV
jgi:hypothetical protein